MGRRIRHVFAGRNEHIRVHRERGRKRGGCSPIPIIAAAILAALLLRGC